MAFPPKKAVVACYRNDSEAPLLGRDSFSPPAGQQRNRLATAWQGKQELADKKRRRPTIDNCF